MKPAALAWNRDMDKPERWRTAQQRPREAGGRELRGGRIGARRDRHRHPPRRAQSARVSSSTMAPVS
jgi:hypothetical protein